MVADAQSCWVVQHHPDWYGDYDEQHRWRDLYWWGPAIRPTFNKPIRSGPSRCNRRLLISRFSASARSSWRRPCSAGNSKVAANRALASGLGPRIASDSGCNSKPWRCATQQQRLQQVALQQAREKNLLNAQQLAQLKTAQQQAQQRARMSGCTPRSR